MKINIGMSEADRKKVTASLEKLLADTQILYLKTQGYHWNVTGPQFGVLHTMFEDQYNELAAAKDVIAERIRTLGYPASASFVRYAEIASISEDKTAPSAEQMAAQLARDNETASATAKEVFKIAQQADDEGTSDMVVQRMQVHEKVAWMMRSMVDGADLS